MRSKPTLLSAILGLSILAPIQASAVDRPDFADPYVPQIKSIKMSYETKQGSGGYSIDLKFNLVVRVHRNPLSTFEIFFSGGEDNPLSPCQTLRSTSYTYGNGFNTKPGNFTVPSGLVSRIADGDWFIETHQFQVLGSRAWPTPNQNFPPCTGVYKAGSIQMRDLAGHGVQIFRSDGSPLGPHQMRVDGLPMDSDQSVCAIDATYAKLCTQQVDYVSLDMTFTKNIFNSESQILVVDFQAQNNALLIQVEELNNRLKLLTLDKTTLQNQVSSLTNDRTSLQKRLAAICKSKPKPKGC